MNPYQAPRSPAPDRPRRARPPWFRRVCDFRTHAAHLGILVAIGCGVAGAVLESRILGTIAGIGLALFATAVLAAIPLTLLGLCVGYRDGRGGRKAGR